MTDEAFIATLCELDREFILRMRELLGDKCIMGAILWDGHVVPTDLTTATIWQFRHPEMVRVGLTYVGNPDAFDEVSTVFLISPHSGRAHGTADHHFETMVFGPKGSRGGPRYLTLEQARSGHRNAVEETVRFWPKGVYVGDTKPAETDFEADPDCDVIAHLQDPMAEADTVIDVPEPPAAARPT